MSTTTATSGEYGRTDLSGADLDISRRLPEAGAQQAKDGPGEVALERPERLTALFPSACMRSR